MGPPSGALRECQPGSPRVAYRRMSNPVHHAQARVGMRRRSGRKCIEMAKWVEPARLGTELARLSTEPARFSTELARLGSELARLSTELARLSTESARLVIESARLGTEPALVT